MYAEIVGLASSNTGDTLWLLSSAFDYFTLNSGSIYHPETTVGMPIQLFPYNWYGQFTYDSFITLGSFSPLATNPGVVAINGASNYVFNSNEIKVI